MAAQLEARRMDLDVGSRQRSGSAPAAVNRGRAASVRPGARPGPPIALVRLPLTDAERAHFALGDFTADAAGQECLAGLNHSESLDYIELQRRGLDNDDPAFLRYIELGDRHVVARRRPEAP